jgi:hypothetical protein
MIPILEERFPRARVLALHAEAPPAEEGPGPEGTGGAARWDPGLPLSPEDFLERELGNLAAGARTGGGFGAESIKIIEWRPSRDRYGERYLRLLAAAAAAVRRFDAEQRTLRAFGRRWLRNFFKNLRFSRYVAAARGLSLPVVVTGAGPSLEGSLEAIGSLWGQGDCLVIAASSSVPALFSRGIVPDLVVSTDGGGWALLHLYELFRRAGPGGAAGPEGGGWGLAASFTAGLPSQCNGIPILGIGDGSLWQTLVLRGLGIPHLALPQRGTVTATALDLALALSRGSVGIAGVDLETQDIRTHARPYSFDRLWREGASRFRPEYSQLFFRHRATREGGSHRIYAEWFASQLASYPGRLQTLGNNHPLFAGLPRMQVPEPSAPGAPGRSGGAGGKSGGGAGIFGGLGAGNEGAGGAARAGAALRAGNGRGRDPVSQALAILKAGLGDPAAGKTLAGELAPLLLSGEPGRPGVRESGLWAELESLARPYRGAAGGAGIGD